MPLFGMGDAASNLRKGRKRFGIIVRKDNLDSEAIERQVAILNCEGATHLRRLPFNEEAQTGLLLLKGSDDLCSEPWRCGMPRPM